MHDLATGAYPGAHPMRGGSLHQSICSHLFSRSPSHTFTCPDHCVYGIAVPPSRRRFFFDGDRHAYGNCLPVGANCRQGCAVLWGRASVTSVVTVARNEAVLTSLECAGVADFLVSLCSRRTMPRGGPCSALRLALRRAAERPPELRRAFEVEDSLETTENYWGRHRR